MPSQCVLNSFAHTTTIIMIGLCSSYQTIAFHRSCVQSFLRYREYFMSANGKCFDLSFNFLNLLHFFKISNFICSGLHQQKENCNPNHVISNVRNCLKNMSSQFYVEKLKATNWKPIWPSESRTLKLNGGWSDIRDHNLCLSYTAPRLTNDQDVE